MGILSGLELGTSRFYEGRAQANADEREKLALEELRRNREVAKRHSQIGAPDYNYNPELGAVNPQSLAAVEDPEDYSVIDTEPTTRDFREPGLVLRDIDKRPVTNEEFGTAVFGSEYTSPEEQLREGESKKPLFGWDKLPGISQDPTGTYDESGRRRPDTGLKNLLNEVANKNYPWGVGKLNLPYGQLKTMGISAYDYAAREFYRSPEALKILSSNPRLISEFRENPTELYKKLRRAGVLKEDPKNMRTNIARGKKDGFMPDAVEFFSDISALKTKDTETKESKDYAAKRVESVTESIATDRLENKVSEYTKKQALLLGIDPYHALTLLAMESDFGTTGKGKNNPLGITAETYNEMINGVAGYAALSEDIKKAGVADSYAKSSKEDRILMGLLRFKYSKDIVGVDNDKLGAAYNGSAEKVDKNLYDKEMKLYSQDYNDAFNQVYEKIQAAYKPSELYTPEAGMEFGGGSIEQKAVTYLSNAGTEAQTQGGYTNVKTRQEHIVEQNLNYLNQHRAIAAEYGANDKVKEVDALIAGEHAKLWHQQGLRGLQNLFTAGDFSKLQQVLQTATGNSWELQVTADGKYTAINNGKPHKLITGVTAEKAHHEFKKIIDANYYKQTVETAISRSGEKFTANLEMIKELAVEQLKGQFGLDESATDIKKRITVDTNQGLTWYLDAKTGKTYNLTLGSYKDADGKRQKTVNVDEIDFGAIISGQAGLQDTSAGSYLDFSKLAK